LLPFYIKSAKALLAGALNLRRGVNSILMGKLNRDYQRNLYHIVGMNEKDGGKIELEFEATPDEVPGRVSAIKRQQPGFFFNPPDFIRRIIANQRYR
jgi:hypothetical protein